VAAYRTSTSAWYIAWLGLGHAGTPSPYLDSLRTGLRELGWTEGRNLKIVAFWATGREDMDGVAREVLASDPDVVVTQELMAIAMRNLQSAKPVVFGFSGDPVDGNLVQSWARPVGNFTGMSYLAIELVGKRIELLKEWLPQIRRVAVLARPQHPGAVCHQQSLLGKRRPARDGRQLGFQRVPCEVPIEFAHVRSAFGATVPFLARSDRGREETIPTDMGNTKSQSRAFSKLPLWPRTAQCGR